VHEVMPIAPFGFDGDKQFAGVDAPGIETKIGKEDGCGFTE
jgi:hypothetical protein